MPILGPRAITHAEFPMLRSSSNRYRGRNHAYTPGPSGSCWPVALVKKPIRSETSDQILGVGRTKALPGRDARKGEGCVAVGVDTDGKKHVLGMRQGASENTEVTMALLEDLVERGLDPGQDADGCG